MAGRGSLRQASPRKWLIRAGIATIAALIGYFAVVTTLAFTIRAEQPDRAFALAPWDARVDSAMAEYLSGPAATSTDRAQADRLALIALRRDGTNVSAAATLGLNAEARENGALAQRWFNYAEALSRRDLRTQLWAIEHAVGAGKVAAALHHYDIALRTSRKSFDLLFPVLESALSDPSIRAELVRSMAQKPVWGDAFVSHAAENGVDRSAVALFLAQMDRAGLPVADRAKALIVTRLMDANEPEAAWAYYTAVHPGVSRDASRDPQFRANLSDPTTFDWQPVDDGGLSASIQRGEHGGLVDFSAPAGMGGMLLRQTQMLKSGRYLLSGHSIGLDAQSTSRPYWTLICGDGRTLGRVDIPNSSQAGGNFSGGFFVPDDCRVQTLALMAPASDDVAGLSGQIDRAVLRPAG